MRRTSPAIFITFAAVSLWFLTADRAGGRGTRDAESPTLLDFLDADTAAYLVIPDTRASIATLRTDGPLQLLENETCTGLIERFQEYSEGLNPSAAESQKLRNMVSKFMLNGRQEAAGSTASDGGGAIHWAAQLPEQTTEADACAALDKIHADVKTSDTLRVTRMEDGDGWKVWQKIESPSGGPDLENTNWTFIKAGRVWWTTDAAMRERIRSGQVAKSPLRETEAYREAIAAARRGDADAFVFVDEAKSKAAVAPFVTKYDSTGSMNQMWDVLDLIGLWGRGHWASSCAFVDGTFRERLVHQMHKDDEGLLALAGDNAQPGLSLMDEAPGDAVFYFGAKVDPDGLFDDAFDLMTRIAEFAGGSLPEDATLDSAEVQQFREFLVDSFTGECSIAVVLRNNAVVPEVLITAVLTDDNTLSELAEGIVAGLGGEGLDIREVDYLGHTLFVGDIEDAPVSPTFAFTDDRLYVGLAPNTVKRAISRKGDTLSDRTEFKAAAERLETPLDRAVALAWLDAERLARYGYGFIDAIEMAGAFPEGMDAGDLPDVDTLAPHLGCTLAAATVSDRLLAVEMNGKITPMGSFLAMVLALTIAVSE